MSQNQQPGSGPGPDGHAESGPAAASEPGSGSEEAQASADASPSKSESKSEEKPEGANPETGEAAPTDESGQPWRPSVNPWLIAIAVMSGTFMEVLDTSIANVALPHMAGTLASTVEETTWMVTAYLVANAIVLPLTGWITKTFGRKRFLLFCIVLFTVASGLSGAAQSLTQLILFRILQGAGGGALQPVAQSILLESFPPEKRGLAMAFYGLGIVVAPVLGPILGGYLTDNYSWRWSFYINLPIGIMATLLVSAFIEDPPRKKSSGKAAGVDYWGFIYLAVWVGALQVMLDKGNLDDWFDSTFICAMAVIFAVFLMFFLAREVTAENPIVDLSVFRDANFALSTVMIFIVGAVLYGSITLGPLFTQQLLGYPAFQAGLAVAPRGLGAIAAMLIVGPLLAVLDGRLFVGLGFLLLGISNLWLGHYDLTVGLGDFFWPNIVSGLGTGMVFVPLSTIANDRLAASQIPSASGLFNLSRNVGGGIGIAMAQTAVSRLAQIRQVQLASNITVYNPVVTQTLNSMSGLGGGMRPVAALYGQIQRQTNMLAYMSTYTVAAYFCFACLPLVLLLKKPKKGAASPGGH